MPKLPVLPSHPAPARDIAADLGRLLRGPVNFDGHHRMLFSTDASIYQVPPIGVVTPADEIDVQNLLRYCTAKNLPVLPRGGGTSLAGQCTSAAIVCDLSAACRSIVGFDVATNTLHVQAGPSIDEVNRWLVSGGHKVFFAPDPATGAQCAIGGAIGNNAAGARSIRYGRTSENIAALKIVLPNGDSTWLGPAAGRACPTARQLARHVASIIQPHAALIRDRFPKLNRRNAGYAIDSVLMQLDAGVAVEDLDLIGLMCGSEGTLGIVTEAKLKLHPLPRARGLAIVSFDTLENAIDRVSSILDTGAIAIELLDEEVLTAAAHNLQCRTYLDLIEPLNGVLPRAVLYVEYQNESEDDRIGPGFAELRRAIDDQPMRIYTDAASMTRAWALRKAGEPLLHGLSSTRKPQTFVEDNSIPVENLSRFVREFKQIVARHGTRAAYYAHAGAGVLHIRPMIDLKDRDDREHMVAIATEIADLAKACGGVMSGEHGDGRVRGPLLERFFGTQIMQCFRQVKAAFDPAGILNPDMIVRPGHVRSIVDHLRVDAGVVPDIETYFDYSDQENFHGAVEMCNGAGFCRKTAGGTMCPSYRATFDERHSTRGRGNALRLAISGQLRRDSSGRPDFADAGTMETLDLCLSCKACKSECPSNVDIARLKAEYTAQRHAWHGVPLAIRVFGNIRAVNRFGALAPRLANAFSGFAPTRAVLNLMLNLAPQRSLPKFARSLYTQVRSHDPARRATRKRVVLFGDCFTVYNEPRIGVSAIRVLERLGYEVVLPKVGCCARAMISTGLLPEAIRTADKTLKQLRSFINDPNVIGIVVAEPSCLASFKDDWLQLKLKTPIGVRRRLSEKSFLIEEFIEKFWDHHPTPIPQRPRKPSAVILHGHCHQKALWGDETSAAILRRLVGDGLTVLPSGCCGLAGSFGYAKHRYDLSMKIGELSVFPPIRTADEAAVIVAPGTSCRHQIHDGTARRAIHPIELVDQLLSP